MSRLPRPGERARILSSEYMDHIGATGRVGVVIEVPNSIMTYVVLDDWEGVGWREAPTRQTKALGCTISEVELVKGSNG